ncbi:MAG: SpoIIE family protein phosphatase [Acidobacteriaceae bacterium]|nr:SpoIIE family protein phosphatase [Acidobacteriaceae bacterium]
MAAHWRQYRYYILILPLCALALLYQITSSVVGVNMALHARSMPDYPFMTSADGTVGLAKQAAERAGLHRGDRILSVDGRTLGNDRELVEKIVRHRPGEMMTVTEMPKGQTAAHTMRIAVPPIATSESAIGDVIFVCGIMAVKLFCVLVAVYVLVRLPGDKRVWLAFGLLLSLSQVVTLDLDWFRFPESLWVFANGWRLACILNWSFVIAAFGLYFPQQFPWDLRRPWIKWLYLGPVLCINSLVLMVALSPQFRYGAFATLDRVLRFPLFNPQLLIATSITLFFSFIGMKQGTATSGDVKRRLRLLEVGAGIGLGPVGLLLVAEALFHVPESSISETLVITTCILFAVFPLTLAYVVLTERALDLRVVVRQGVRYTMMRGGLRVLLFAVGSLFFWRLSVLLSRPGIGNVTRVVVLATAILAAVFIMRRVRAQAFTAIDRKFFRDHYQSEAVLSELSENVRNIVDERELLETVSHQVSNALHVAHFSVLMNTADGFRPVYSMGLAVPERIELPQNSQAIALLTNAKEPAPIYFDRPDNWIHNAPEDELVTLKALGAQLLLPLKTKEKLLGLFCLGPKLSEEPFSKTDINLLRTVALQTGLALDNSRLTTAFAQEVAQRERLNREIEIAREVQERLFPQRLPVIAGIDYFGSCRPALGVGGDYYDFLQLPNGDLGVAIGDVSGKGIAAALLMASLQASLRGQALTGTSDLAQLMCNVNQLIYGATPSNRYATFFYAQYTRRTGMFRYVNAGHNPPFVLRRTSDGTIHVIRLDCGGPVVGLFAEAPYQQGSLILQPGDVFVGFTDGISEAMNRAEEEWGEEHLITSVANHVNNGAADMVPRLMADADRFVDGAPQHDDMTLVVVKLQPEAVAA